MTSSIVIRPATPADAEPLDRLLRRAACLYPRGLDLTATNAPMDGCLLVTAWKMGRLRGVLGVTALHPSTAKIEAIGIHLREDLDGCLAGMLAWAEVQLRERGTETLIYIGHDAWLIAALRLQGFQVADSILLFRKRGWEVPDPGNQGVSIRPATLEDTHFLVALDESAFREALWRNNADAFHQWLSRMCHSVVAEWKGQIVGYQFSDVQEDEGYLARVVVHPAAQGERIGVRLMTEAIGFFRRQGIRTIALNTQGDNHRAQRLYGWFGFRRAGREALVLQKRVSE